MQGLRNTGTGKRSNAAAEAVLLVASGQHASPPLPQSQGMCKGWHLCKHCCKVQGAKVAREARDSITLSMETRKARSTECATSDSCVLSTENRTQSAGENGQHDRHDEDSDCDIFGVDATKPIIKQTERTRTRRNHNTSTDSQRRPSKDKKRATKDRTKEQNPRLGFFT